MPHGSPAWCLRPRRRPRCRRMPPEPLPGAPALRAVPDRRERDTSHPAAPRDRRPTGADGPAAARSSLEAGVHLLAPEQPLLRSPGEEDDDAELDRLSTCLVL